MRNTIERDATIGTLLEIMGEYRNLTFYIDETREKFRVSKLENAKG